ncbi:MAG: hypothetical protein ACLR4C_03200 [Eubacterium ventriosum]
MDAFQRLNRKMKKVIKYILRMSVYQLKYMIQYRCLLYAMKPLN